MNDSKTCDHSEIPFDNCRIKEKRTSILKALNKQICSALGVECACLLVKRIIFEGQSVVHYNGREFDFIKWGNNNPIIFKRIVQTLNNKPSQTNKRIIRIKFQPELYSKGNPTDSNELYKAIVDNCGVALISVCDHDWVVTTAQIRTGDEAANHLKRCSKCGFIKRMV